MLGSDGNLWVVKFQNNPQHRRVLGNEIIATHLAAAAGLTVPQVAAVNVSAWMIENTPELYVDIGGRKERCAAGLNFGTRFVGGLMPGHVVDDLPDEQLEKVRNVNEFIGALAFDKWTGNTDGRQAVFSRNARETYYTATFIDHGHCFDAGAWRFEDLPLRGAYPRNLVYAGVRGWMSFEPWLTLMENMEAQKVWQVINEVPPEWINENGIQEVVAEIEILVEMLLVRRRRIRELIINFALSDRRPFPNWLSHTNRS